MLVIARKVGTHIRIADNIVVRVLEIQGSRVKIGIEAPTEISILRSRRDASSDSSIPKPGAPVAAVSPLVAVPELVGRLPREQRV